MRQKRITLLRRYLLFISSFFTDMLLIAKHLSLLSIFHGASQKSAIMNLRYKYLIFLPPKLIIKLRLHCEPILLKKDTHKLCQFFWKILVYMRSILLLVLLCCFCLFVFICFIVHIYFEYLRFPTVNGLLCSTNGIVAKQVDLTEQFWLKLVKMLKALNISPSNKPISPV
jgi:hypothetical protein